MDRIERFKMAYNYVCDNYKCRSNKDVADVMGATQGNVNRALHGYESALTDRFILRFCKAFPIINVNWLLSEDGEMIANKKETATTQSLENVLANSPDALSALINQVTKLSEHLTSSLQRLDAREAELDKREAELYERTKKIDQAFASAISLEHKYSQLYSSQIHLPYQSHDMASESFNELKTK